MLGGLIVAALVMGEVELELKEDDGHMVSTAVLILPTLRRGEIGDGTSEMYNIFYGILLPMKGVVR